MNAKVIMLGTGNGGTVELYNTCFVIQNNLGNFLVDTGGSIELIKRLRQVNIDYKEIKHIFISHSHSDHILGLFWYFKEISGPIMSGELNEKINIYCNDAVYEAIKHISEYIWPSKLTEAVYKVLNFIILNDGDNYEINGIKYKFIDIKARGFKQFGFDCNINNKRLIFLGDETLKPELYNKIKGADYVMHEAFCLDAEKEIFKPHEKNHATVKDVAETMNELSIKNLILYHTEETHGQNRTALYLKEGKEYFNGNIIVPDDLEELEIN